MADYNFSEDSLTKFWSKVVKSENSCWKWVGAKDSKTSRGWFSAEGKGVNAYRLMYYLIYGPFDETLCVCHYCDNPNCVRPDHLFLGTDYENLNDMWNKQRGSINITANKLSWELVEEIRGNYASGFFTQRELSIMFNVSPTTICEIVNNKTWKNETYEYIKLHDEKMKRENKAEKEPKWQKLKVEVVLKIKKFLSDGFSDKEISELLGVSESRICCIKNNKSWAWLNNNS